MHCKKTAVRTPVLVLLFCTCLSAALAQTDKATFYYQRGLAMNESRDYPVAVRYFDSALVEFPTFDDASNNRGIALYHLRQYREAAAEYQRIIDRNPSYYAALNNLGNALYELHDYNRAIDALNRALKISPDNNNNALNTLGNVYFMQKDYPLAIDTYKKIIASNPLYADAYNNIGLVFQKTGPLDSAIAWHQRSLELEPENAMYHYNLGYAYGIAHNFDLAIEQVNIALKLDPRYADAYWQMGHLVMERGNYNPQEAISYFDQAIALNTSQMANAYSGRGIAYYAQGDYKAAIADYDRALAIDPLNASAYSGKASIQKLTGSYEDAMRNFLRSVYVDSAYAFQYLGIGNILLVSGHTELADSFYTLYYDHRNRSTEASAMVNNDKCFNYTLINRYADALPYCSQAILDNPRYAYAYNNKGMALAKLKQPDSALYYINRSISIDPYNSYAFHHRAYVYAIKGDTRNACADLKQALDMHYPQPIDPLLLSLNKSTCRLKYTVPDQPDSLDAVKVLEEANSERARLRNMVAESRDEHERIVTRTASRSSTVFTETYEIDINPNPADVQVSILLNRQTPRTYSVSIFNNSGLRVKYLRHLVPSELITTFTCDDLTPGRYVVMVMDEQRVISRGLLQVNH